MKLMLLRAFLGLGAATWGAAAPGVFLKWQTAADAMEGFGAGPVTYDRMLDYWLRMASGAFALVGCLYLLLMFRPRQFREMIPWMGWFALVEGVILLGHGVRLGLHPWPFYGDVSACFVSGGGILICWRSARTSMQRANVEPSSAASAGQAPASLLRVWVWRGRLSSLGVMTPMGMLCIVVFLAGSSWALGALVHRLRRAHASARWWVGFLILGLLGISGGIWCANSEYPLGQHFRIGSFPIPVVFFHLEDGQWVDFPVPRFQAWSAVLTNIITITALATVPLWFLSWRQHRHEQTQAQPVASATAG